MDSQKLQINFKWKLRSVTKTEITKKVKKKSKEFLKRDAERKRRKYVPIALRSEKEQRVVREKNREKTC